MTRFLLIRHATTDANGRRLVGRLPGIDLNRRGREEAQRLAIHLRHSGIDAIYASPLERALRTAGPIATLLGLEVATREEFLEIEFGEWTGKSLDELAGVPRFRRFNALRSCTAPPGGEFMGQVQARMVAGLEALRVRHPGQCVAVVGHGDVIKSAIAHYAGIPLDLLLRIRICPASVSAVDVDDAGACIAFVNAVGGREDAWARCAGD